jgi:ABC-type amino acid transport substrate-binding protein
LLKIFKMKVITIALLTILASISVFSQANSLVKGAERANGPQTKNEIIIHYFNQEPFAYSSNGNLTGIEIDILQEFGIWLKLKKNTPVNFTFKGYESFNEFYSAVTTGEKNFIGAGSVTINEERKKQIDYSAPYLNNVSVLITQGSIPTINSKNEAKDVFKNMKGITTKESVHNIYMNDLKATFVNDLELLQGNSPIEILDKIQSNKSVMGYVDMISFWNYLRKRNVYLKIQRPFNITQEKFAFVFPKGSEYNAYMNEFFESGFGFTSTKKYRDILEKHLSFEVIRTVEITE